MAAQPGDFVAFARLAWDIYRLGWAEDSNATRKYVEFGRDVRNLASSLDILSSVVAHAHESLAVSASAVVSVSASASSLGSATAAASTRPRLRWDPGSLLDIIGDYEDTLRECRKLIYENRRYGGPVSPLRTLEWNVLVQPAADRLRARIQMHTSKVMLVLRPLEMDLLTSVRQDIQRMHAHLSWQIRSMHADLHRLIGVMVPDVEQELRQQRMRDIQLIRVPEDIAQRFDAAAAAVAAATVQNGAPPPQNDRAIARLQELCEAYVAHWGASTLHFVVAVLPATPRTVPVAMWLALLKCVWIMERIRACIADTLPEGSHWPSYVRQLEDELSKQCRRVGLEIAEPDAAAVRGAPAHMFAIWPQKPLPELVEVVTQDELMECVLVLPLRCSTVSIERNVQLLRRPSASSTASSTAPRRFRAVITGTDASAVPPRREVQTIDFDLRSAQINPLYASPGPAALSLPEIILRKDERIAKLVFGHVKDLLKFQQGLCGYKVWAGKTCHNVVCNFILPNRRDPIREKASVQLWIPKLLPGSLVKTNSSALIVPGATPAGLPDLAFGDTGTGMGIPVSCLSAPPPAHSSVTGLPLSSSPPSARSGMAHASARPNHSQSTEPSSLCRVSTPALASSSPNPGRASSMSSEASTALGALSTRTSNSSSSDTHTVTLTLGRDSVGTLYEAPPPPVLVIYTQDSKGTPSIVMVRLDQGTAVNPERCNCRQAGRGGAECPITAVEQNQGRGCLVARRFEPSPGQETVWPLAEMAAALAEGARAWTAKRDGDEWKNLKRVSFLFEGGDGGDGASARARFGGTPNRCGCKIRREGDLMTCMRSGHGGLLGEVAELYRRQMNDYYQARYTDHRHVVNGRRDDAR